MPKTTLRGPVGTPWGLFWVRAQSPILGRLESYSLASNGCSHFLEHMHAQNALDDYLYSVKLAVEDYGENKGLIEKMDPKLTCKTKV